MRVNHPKGVEAATSRGPIDRSLARTEVSVLSARRGLGTIHCASNPAVMCKDAGRWAVGMDNISVCWARVSYTKLKHGCMETSMMNCFR